MDAFDIQGNNGNSTASGSATSAALLNGALSGKQQSMRIVTDGYLRVKFGNSSVVADSSSPMYAPGEAIIHRQNESPVYYSVLSVSGTSNWSINPGQIVTLPAKFI